MDLTAVTLAELRYAATLAAVGHFGRAAAACHVTQPTLSAAIRKLEENLGVRLFERTPRGVRVTAAGQAIVARAQAALAEVEAIGDVARQRTDPLVGRLRVGVIPTLGPYLLPWLVARVQATFPRLRLAVREQTTARLLDDLAAGQLDVALLALPVSAPGTDCAPLFDEPFWLLAPADHALARRARVDEAQLAGHRVLLLTDGHCLREQALAVCGGSTAADADDFRATSLETLRHLVAAGIGVTLVPGLAVPALATAAGVAVRPFRAPAPGRRVGLVWRRSDPQAAGLRDLAAALRARLPDGVLPTDVAGVTVVPAAVPSPRRRRRS